MTIKMNITLDQYITGLEYAVVELPKIFVEWESIDEDLCEDYIDQLVWSVKQETNVLKTMTPDDRYTEIATRIVGCNAKLVLLRFEIEQKMGIKIEDLLSDEEDV